MKTEIQSIQYLASIGIRANDTKANRETYGCLVEITFKAFSENVSSEFEIEYLYFLDCVANNILGVQIFADKKDFEPNVQALKVVYYKLKQIHDSYEREEIESLIL